MADTIYYLWLQCALGISPSLRTQEILAAFPGGAREIYAAGDYDRRVAGVFTGTQLSRLQRTPLEQAEKILEECARHKAHILSPQDADYPERLLQIPNHPLVLYVRGSLAPLRAHLPLAVVGARMATFHSRDIAARLSADLVHAGCAIISGGAAGIDSAAHRGAMHADGYTLAVFGCGLDVSYPPENAAMFAKIAEKGALVSEFPFGTAPNGRNFPMRNRLIAGISAGTVIIEANEKSGSLRTAACAGDQGRDVFAVPGDAFGTTYTGGNRLIRDGAKPVFSAMDILEEYELVYPELLDMRRAERDLERPAADPASIPVRQKAKPIEAKPVKANAVPTEGNFAQEINPEPALTELESKIMQLLSDKAMHIDSIMNETNAPFGQLFAALMNLEMRALAEQMPGKLYSKRK